VSARQAHTRFAVWLGPAILLAALLWSYWPTVVSLAREWDRDEDYSVGMLVPVAALYLLWTERHRLAALTPRICWWGIGVILVAQAARAYGLVFLFESAERYSFVLTIVGLVLLMAGWPVFRGVGWILAFLFLMIPLPGRVHNAIASPLQTMATVGAVHTLELLGVTVEREGNTMRLNGQVSVAVAEACSGLRMLTAFVVVAATLAYVVNRPGWQKAGLLLSSVPVAIVCNLVRLVVTAGLFLYADAEIAQRFFHDLAGWTLMPLAVLMLMGELWLFSKLVVPDTPNSKP